MKHVYFIGIGGSGMMPLARLAKQKGFCVGGADIHIPDSKKQLLEQEGIKVHIRHEPAQIGKVDYVVYSSAISKEHPERLWAQKQASTGRLALFHRMDFLNLLVSDKALQIAIAGTHGKTSTASLAGWALLQMGLDPEILVGGHPLYLASGIRKGDGEVAVFETDESDGSFLKTKAPFRLLLNIDQDHLEHYGSFGALKKAFREFLLETPQNGLAVINADDPNICSILAEKGFSEQLEKRLFWYSTNPKKADLLPKVLKPKGAIALFDSKSDCLLLHKLPSALKISPFEKKLLKKDDTAKIQVSLPGRHFASNALGLFCLLRLAFCSASSHTILSSFGDFPGVERRMQLLFYADGISIYDDYAHHPTEIEAVLKALRLRLSAKGKGRLVALFEPHRYTRTKKHYQAFAQALELADVTWFLPLYAAGEKAIDGVDASLVAGALLERLGLAKMKTKQIQEIPKGKETESLRVFLQTLQKDDILVCLGAGSISKIIRKALKLWQEKLPA